MPNKSQRYQGEISVYDGTGGLTREGYVKGAALIKKAFPALPDDFYKVLFERLLDNGFNDARFHGAITMVIDTCKYPTPTIANFISYDKRYRVYSYDEIVQMVSDNVAIMGRTHKAVRLPERVSPVWISVDDIERYNLKPINEE